MQTRAMSCKKKKKQNFPFTSPNPTPFLIGICLNPFQPFSVHL